MESRALFFNARVCREITAKCVPFARNSRVGSGYAADGRFWAKLENQGVHLGNSMFLCTADGQAVEGFRDSNLDLWLASWQKLPESKRGPGALVVEDRGSYRDEPRNPRPPAGALFVKTYTRALDRDAQGRLFAPEKLSLGISKTVIKSEPNRDCLWIRAQEGKGLIPKRLRKGDRFPVPPRLRDRVFRFHLVDGACCLPGFWTPEEIHGGELTLSIEHVTPNAAQMAMSGSARVGRGKSPIEFTIQGRLVYDRAQERFIRFDAVALSRSPCHRDTATGRLLPLGIAFELGQPDSPLDRRVPYRIWYDMYGFRDYFRD